MEGLTRNIADGNIVDVGQLRVVENSSIDVKGTGNTLKIEDGCMLRNARIVIESHNSHLRLGARSSFSGAIYMKGAGSNRLNIGSGSTFGAVNIICGEGSSFTCGEDCMFAWGIEIRTTDSHGIYDLETGDRINQAADVAIGDHVWIAAKATLLKGISIASGSVVGIGSVVTTDFDESNTLIVGNPARSVRKGIRWERPLLG